MAIYARHDLDQLRQALVMHRTWELAMSGRYDGTAAITAQLHADGHADADRWLASPQLRDKIDDVAALAMAFRSRALPPPHLVDAPSDEARIWHLLETEVAAFWFRNFEAYAACNLHLPQFRFQAWVREEGLTLRTGWDEFARNVAEDFRRDPIPNPYIAFASRLDDRSIRVSGDMAWCSYHLTYPTLDLPGFRGPGGSQSIRIVERHDGQWKIVLHSLMDLNFGQTDAPLWQLEQTGRLVWQNPAATRYLADDGDLAVRGGKLRMLDAAADQRLSEGLKELAELDFGFLSRRRSVPIVVDPGNDEPARVWWLVTEHGRLTLSYNDAPLLRARLDTAAAAFGLSPAQHRLSIALVEGLPLADAAERDGVGLSTAKTQLQRIFDKVGVRTQPALVRALLAVTERN